MKAEPIDNFSFERELYAQSYSAVAGIDEAGRGPLAGPVVAACVILPPDTEYSIFQDSKKLSAKRREKLFHTLQTINAVIGIGIVSRKIIDRINIHQASLLAMVRAVKNIPDNSQPDFLLIDGKFTTSLPVSQQPLVKGEQKSSSIAAASIVAKVSRDAIMARLHKRYPVYNFIKNQGYPTREHRQAVAMHGVCPAHRVTYKGVKEFV